MAKKPGRPKGKKGKKSGCQKTTIYHRVKGAVRKVKGFKKKSCLTKK